MELTWDNITSFNQVRSFNILDDSLYLATSGGLLMVTNRNIQPLQIINTDGLGTVDITDIIKDNNNQKWVAGLGRLIKFNFDMSQIYMFKNEDNELIELYKLYDDGNKIWVGTEAGLVLFDKTTDGGQIQDSYELFGQLNPSPDVYDIFIDGNIIYLATSAGIALADKSNPTLLNSPLNWKTYSLIDYSQMGSDEVWSIISFESKLYAATSRAIIEIDTESDIVNMLPIGSGITSARLELQNDTLFYFFDDTFGGGMGYVKNQTITALDINSLSEAPVVGITFDSEKWIATDNKNIFITDGNNVEKYQYGNLPKNDVADMNILDNGIMHVGFITGGLAVYENSEWEMFESIAGVTHISNNNGSGSWIGTFGDGLTLYNNNIFTKYTNSNSTLIGNTDNLPRSLSFIVVNGLAVDGRYLYTACYRAANGFPVVIADLNNLNRWDSLGITEGITNEFVTSLAVHENYMAVGTETVGLYFCDRGDNPFNHDDIVFENHTRENSFIISNSIRVVEFDPDGNLWVGTNFGLSRYNSGIEYYVDVELPQDISSDITALEFDGRGNLWIGTTNGLGYYNATTDEICIYHSENSGLVNDRINAITYDWNTGNTYISTMGGISKIFSLYGSPTTEIEKVIAFPNPFIITGADDRLNFNYSKAGTVRIYNIAGELVCETPVNSGWDGTNQKNEDVASGVYIFILTNDESELARGKIFLVR
ncbi:MAG: two-component regulator propeller domain-containing protein [candidate division Zixibacteria bacterium]|nr:two-component regulator propeller domain-containing protein [candidate division Zixibacteria bacterium]